VGRGGKGKGREGGKKGGEKKRGKTGSVRKPK